MGTLTASLTLTYGDTTPTGNVPRRILADFTFAYTEASTKTVHVAALTSDFAVTLDTVAAPKLVFARALDADVTVKLSDGVVATPTPTTLTSTGGWMLLSSATGQAVNQLLITTGATPAEGAHVEILAFE